MCLRPLQMYPLGLTEKGKRRLFPVSRAYEKLGRMLDSSNIIPVPCGKCDGCKYDKIRDWRSRLILESKVNSPVSFITLTYRDSDLPSCPSKRDIQLFLKCLRNASRDFGVPPFTFRYFIVSEYGERTHRLHYHGLLFGVDVLSPAWRPVHIGFKGVYPLYKSLVLEQIWKHGITTADSSIDSAISYLANYILDDGSHNIRLFSQGIGRGFVLDSSFNPSSLNSHGCDIFQRGTFVHGKFDSLRSSPLPRSLYRYCEKFAPDLFEDLMISRRKVAAEMSAGSPSDYASHIHHFWKETKDKKTL